MNRLDVGSRAKEGRLRRREESTWDVTVSELNDTGIAIDYDSTGSPLRIEAAPDGVGTNFRWVGVSFRHLVVLRAENVLQSIPPAPVEDAFGAR